MDGKTTEGQNTFATVEEPLGKDGKACNQIGPSFKSHDARAVMQKAPSKQQIASIGAASKKRLAKIIEDSSVVDEAVGTAEIPETGKSKRLKKTKRQKLSFQDD